MLQQFGQLEELDAVRAFNQDIATCGLLLGNGVFDLVDICKGAEGAVELLER